MKLEEATALWVFLKESRDLLCIYEKLLHQTRTMGSIPQQPEMEAMTAVCGWTLLAQFSAISTKSQQII